MRAKIKRRKKRKQWAKHARNGFAMCKAKSGHIIRCSVCLRRAGRTKIATERSLN